MRLGARLGRLEAAIPPCARTAAEPRAWLAAAPCSLLHALARDPAGARPGCAGEDCPGLAWCTGRPPEAA